MKSVTVKPGAGVRTLRRLEDLEERCDSIEKANRVQWTKINQRLYRLEKSIASRAESQRSAGEARLQEMLSAKYELDRQESALDSTAQELLMLYEFTLTAQ